MTAISGAIESIAYIIDKRSTSDTTDTDSSTERIALAIHRDTVLISWIKDKATDTPHAYPSSNLLRGIELRAEGGLALI